MGKVKDVLIARSEGNAHYNVQCAGQFDGACCQQRSDTLGTECLGSMLENKTYTVHILKAHPVSHEKVGGRTVVEHVPNAEGQRTFGCPYYALKVGREYMRRHKLDRARMGKHSLTCPYAVHVKEHKETPSVPCTQEYTVDTDEELEAARDRFIDPHVGVHVRKTIRDLGHVHDIFRNPRGRLIAITDNGQWALDAIALNDPF